MRSTTTILFGAVSEILSGMLRAQVDGGSEASNPYLTHDDFDKLRELDARVHELRKKTGCHNFTSAAATLLREEISRYGECAAELSALTSRWNDTERSYASSVREILKRLELEVFILRHTEPKSPFARTLPPAGELHRDLSSTDIAERVDAFRPDAERLEAALRDTRAALDGFSRSANELADRCSACIGPLLEKVVDRRVVVPKGDSDHDARTDLGSLSVPGRQYAFMEFSKPPALQTLDCDSALSLWLNVAEDVAGGAIHVADSKAIKAVYNDFMAAVQNVDRMLASVTLLENRCREGVASAETTYRTVVSALTLDRVTAAAESIRGTTGQVRKALTRALQFAQIGDTSLARRLAANAAAEARGLLSMRPVEAMVEKQLARQSAMERSFRHLAEEAERQSAGWRGVLGDALRFLNSHDDLRERLEDFYRNLKEVRWGPGSECCQKVLPLAREANTWSELSGFQPQLPLWLVLGDALDRARPQNIDASLAFAHALCAMAHAHDGISAPEMALIDAALQEHAVAVAPDDVRSAIQRWRKLPRDRRTVNAVAQAIVNIAAINDTGLLDGLAGALRSVAQVDGELATDEIAVYHGFLTTITRLRER